MSTRGVLWFLAISLIIGQTVRLPVLGQSGGFLVSDAAVAVLLLVAGSKYYVSRNRETLATHYLLLTTPFVLWSAFTLAVNSSTLEFKDLAVAGSYWLRTSAYLLLLPALLVIVRDPLTYQTLRRSFVAAGVIVTLLGFLQLILLPRLALLPAILVATSGGGWDPHEGRLVSTWFDPNFVGAFLGFVLFYLAAAVFTAQAKGQKLSFMTLTAAVAIAGSLTQSRSSASAVGAALLLMSPLMLLRLTVRQRAAALPLTAAVTSLSGLAAGLTVVLLGDRALGLLTFDPTITLRLQALASIWSLAQEHLLFGVGYNAWQFAARDAGLLTDFSLHSRAGADNSFLTLAVTTGIPGLILFCVPWLAVARQLLGRWLVQGQIVALAAVTSLLSLAIQAQFINSFLYAHLLVTLAIVTTLALSVSPTHVQSLPR